MSWQGGWTGSWLGGWLGANAVPSETVVDTIASGDSQTALVATLGALVESLLAADAQSAQLAAAAAVSESITAVDSQSSLAALVAAYSDAVAAAESQSSLVDVPASESESAAAGDTQTSQLAAVAAATESVAASEAQAALADVIAEASDSVAATDLQAAAGAFFESVTETLAATDSQISGHDDIESITETCTILDTCDASVTPAPTPPPAAGGAGPGGWFPSSPNTRRGNRPAPRTGSKVGGGTLAVEDVLVSTPDVASPQELERLRREITRLQERYTRHTQYLRQTLDRQKQALADAEKRVAGLRTAGTANEAEIARLRSEVNALREKVQAAELRETVSPLLRRKMPRSLNDMLAGTVNVAPAPSRELVPVEVHVPIVVPARQSFAPIWWAAAGLVGVGVFLPKKMSSQRTSCFVLAGALALAGAVRWAFRGLSR